MPRIAKMNVLPPGGYKYVQPETGMQFDGNTLFRAQARLIATHRKANSLPRSSREEVEEDLMAYTCQRVPGICIDGSPAKSSAPPANGNPGPKRRCATCGGRKAKQ